MAWADPLRRWTDGIGGFIAGACALVVFAILALLLIVQSPSDMLLWTGTRVTGHTCGGLVCYSYDRQNFTLDIPGTPPDHQRKAVLLRPADPSDAEVDSQFERAGDLVLTVVPVVAGFGLVLVGCLRRRKEAARSART